MSKVKLLWKATSVALAQRGPRVLEFLNREGKTEFFPPEMDGDGNILYEVAEEYGRRLLAGQSDRFFLVSPAKLIIKKRRKDNMGAEYVTVKAISGMTPPAPDPVGAAQSPGTPTDVAQVSETGLDAAGASPASETAQEANPSGSAADVATPGAGVAHAQTGKHKDRPKPTA